MSIPKSEWKWFGTAGHFICANRCEFHLTTQVGDVLVSTVGQYLPESAVREIFAETRGVKLEGRGDDRNRDYLRKVGYEPIGLGRLYETMVFRCGAPCVRPECNCGLPTINGSDLDFAGYNTAGDAARGHLAMCEKWADREGRPAPEN